jgi:hypothetical protein
MRPRIPRIRFGRRFARIFLGIVLFLLALAGVAAWQVPRLVKSALTHDVSAMLGRDVKVGKTTFNPFTLTLRVRDLAVVQPGGAAPLLKLEQGDISVAWRSLIFLAPVVDSLRLHEPVISLVRDGPRHFNFDDVQKKVEDMLATPSAEPKQDRGVPRFSLNNVVLENGSITLDDQVTRRKQVIDEIDFALPFISSFGYATKIDVLPRFHASINGSPIDLRGTALPFAETPSSTLNVVFSGLALDKWADAWPASLPVKMSSGLLDSDLHITFEQPANAPARLRITGGVAVRDLDLQDTSGDGLLAWKTFTVRKIDLQPLEHKVQVGEVQLIDPLVYTRRYADQRVNWLNVISGLQKLATSGAPAPARPAPPTATVPQPAPAPAPATAPVPAPATAPAPASAPVAASQPKTAATPAPAPAAAAEPWQIAVEEISIGDGRLELRDAPTQVQYALQKLNATVQHVRLPQPKDQPIGIWLTADNPDGARIRAMGPLILQPLSLNLDLRLAGAPLQPFAQAVRAAAPIQILDGKTSLSAQVAVADRNGAIQASATDIKFDAADLSVRDDGVKPPVTAALKSLSIAVDRYAPGAASSKFDIKAAGIQGEGKLAAQGTLGLQPLNVNAAIDLAGLDLTPFAGYIASSLNAAVRSITVGAKGDLQFTAAQGATPMKLDWKGGVEVTNLDLRDRVNRADFLSWKSLSLQRMNVAMAGGEPRIGLGDVNLDGFFGRVILSPEGRLNVMDLVAEPGRAGGSITNDTQTRAAPSAAAPEPARGGPAVNGGKAAGNAARKAPASPMPDISVNSITLKDGRANFTDRFVKPNYTADLSRIAGTVSAVSSTNPQPAKVSITGRVYDTAPLSISGIVQPFAKFLTLDIKASAKGVDLPRFTTYAAKYVGYQIERGKLSLDIEYKIKNRELQASNHVVLNQLTFGKKSNSPDATTLPVQLAVSLLKDRNGNIDINLPISGSLDDPQFSVGGIILRVIGNLIVKAVTAPFSLLASAFGGGGEELSYVQFAPGSAALDADAKQRIETVAKALNDRPAIRLDISGRADPATDGPALRQAWVDGRIRAARDRKLGSAAKPGAPLTDADRATYLQDAYSDTKIADKPRNFIGLSKSLPPDQMLDLMRKAAPVNEDQLRRLAEARAQAVHEALQDAPQDRIFIVAPKLSADEVKDGGSPNRVEFSLGS